MVSSNVKEDISKMIRNSRNTIDQLIDKTASAMSENITKTNDIEKLKTILEKVVQESKGKDINREELRDSIDNTLDIDALIQSKIKKIQENLKDDSLDHFIKKLNIY